MVTDLKGIEKFFMDSWKGWDELDYMAIQFYEPKLKESLFPKDIVEKANIFYIDLNSCKFEVYDKEDEVIFSGEIKGVTI